MLVAGCSVSKTTVTKPAGPPAQLQTASKQELVARYNEQAAAISTLNGTVEMTLTAGSAYTGVIKQYREIKAFILAQKPANIRVIGQAPVVGTNIFDMVSDGETFHIFIPSQNKFLVGPANLEKPSAKPIENLRPQHITRAIFWEPIPSPSLILIEEASDETARYYVLTIARNSTESRADTAGEDWEIAEKLWFDRGDLSVVRKQAYEAGGHLASDVRYAGWDAFGSVRYPRQITLTRPENDYKLEIRITKATFNETIPADRLVLNQPPGTELVEVGKESKGETP
jgi:outer membrane lipoprotein-sorting protein